MLRRATAALRPRVGGAHGGGRGGNGGGGREPWWRRHLGSAPLAAGLVGLGLGGSLMVAPTRHAMLEDEAEAQQRVPPARQSTKVRLRRANTRLTSLDSVLMGYEYRLRETASLEKVHKYFSSVVVDGDVYMTPLDLVRAISPGVPPSPNSKPLNIPLFESSTQLEFSKQELPDFFRFGPDDPGLISYDRFLVLVTLLALPASELPVAYRMCAGEDFNNKKFRSSGLNVHNFDFIMQRNIKISGQGYSTEHGPGDIVHYLFGPELKKTLTLDEFRDFHQQLREEVLRLQYYLLSDKMDKEGNPIMSLPAFAKSVAALVPSDYRKTFLERAVELRRESLPPKVVSQEIKRGALGIEVAGQGRVLPQRVSVSFSDYSAWQEILRSLVAMEQAVKTYSYEDGHFTRTNINRAAKAVTGLKLSRAQVWTLFFLFDVEEDNQLHHDQFVRLLKPHGMATDPRYEAEGLGLAQLFSCLRSSCFNCTRNWYEGTST